MLWRNSPHDRHARSLPNVSARLRTESGISLRSCAPKALSAKWPGLSSSITPRLRQGTQQAVKRRRRRPGLARKDLA